MGSETDSLIPSRNQDEYKVRVCKEGTNMQAMP